MTVWTLGSVNFDMVLSVPHLPRPGETLAATGYAEGLGGKGANQSVAAARMGAQVRHIGRVGPDGAGARDRLAALGVDVTYVTTSAQPTGRALITVDAAAENSIVILPGANTDQSEPEIAAALAGAVPGDTLLMQNETDEQVAAARIARDRGLRVVYSAAPFNADAVRAVLPFTSVLLMNAVEAAQLTAALGQPLSALPVSHVVVTRGADGAVLHDIATGTETAHPSLPVSPVDTTGAGDTFAGALAAGLDAGEGWDRAMRRALVAAALATTRPGAAEAIPTRDEVEARL